MNILQKIGILPTYHDTLHTYKVIKYRDVRVHATTGSIFVPEIVGRSVFQSYSPKVVKKYLDQKQEGVNREYNVHFSIDDITNAEVWKKYTKPIEIVPVVDDGKDSLYRVKLKQV